MHPEWDFFIYNSEVYINNSQNISGSYSDNYKGVPAGFLSLYEYNLNRSGSYIYPFVLANSTYKTRFRSQLKNMLGDTVDGVTGYPTDGSEIASSYQMSASITRQYLTVSTLNLENGPVPYHNHTSSVIKNMCLQYQTTNPSFTTRNNNLNQMFSDDVNMINVPSIFYGSEIKKGTLELNYYVTGTLVATAKDENQNGQLICTSGTGSVSGSVVGHVLYREGIVFFPKALAAANRDLDSNTLTYNGSVSSNAKWIYFGGGANDGFTQDSSHASASYSINFEGTTYKNTMTLLCHANKGELNYSNNPTFVNINHSASIVGHSVSEYSYQDSEIEIKNIASSSFHKGEDEFRKVTYISKVGIYDEDNNLLMTVDLARPYKKEEKDNFTFKIKYDLL